MSEKDNSTERATMADVSHTNPYTGETLGASFMRGAVAADGGHEEATTEMRDVSHEPPHGDGTNDVWRRGAEATQRDESAVGPTDADATDDAAPADRTAEADPETVGTEGVADE